MNFRRNNQKCTTQIHCWFVSGEDEGGEKGISDDALLFLVVAPPAISHILGIARSLPTRHHRHASFLSIWWRSQDGAPNAFMKTSARRAEVGGASVYWVPSGRCGRGSCPQICWVDIQIQFHLESSSHFIRTCVGAHHKSFEGSDGPTITHCLV